jgi:hypothetical protein
MGKKAAPLSEMRHLALEFHHSLNAPLRVTDFTSASTEIIWWLGPCGHAWKQRINLRAKRNYGCTICKGLIVLQGFNDLETKYPELAEQWDASKNKITPREITAGSARTLYWLCESGHSYEAPIVERVRQFKKGRPSSCPVCLNRKIVPGLNGLATTYPELLAQWDTGKNSTNPLEIPPGHKKKFWWLCPSGHSYDMSPFHRTTGKQNCPICAGKRVVTGQNDLEHVSPEVAKTWDYSKNPIDVSPQKLTHKTTRLFWWLCDSGHSYRASVAHRTEGRGCPYCVGKKLLTGFNDLKTKRPDLAALWSQKNKVEPSSVLSGSGVLYLWNCKLGHEWRAAPIWVKGCPVCSNKVVLKGFNDLKTIRPDLAEEWHPKKNKISPDQVTFGSGQRVWWICESGHEWQVSPNSRKRTGCPRCGMGGFDQSKPGSLYLIANKSLACRKVGITNFDSYRLPRFSAEGWTVVAIWESENGLLLMELEKAIFRWIRGDLGLPPFLTKEQMKNTGGWSETFSEEGPSNTKLKIEIQKIFNQLQEELEF